MTDSRQWRDQIVTKAGYCDYCHSTADTPALERMVDTHGRGSDIPCRECTDYYEDREIGAKPTSMQLSRYDKLQKEAIEASQTLQAYREEIAKDCDHPTAYVTDWNYEHDNGYGRQTMIPAKFCTICRAEKIYSYWSRDGRTI